MFMVCPIVDATSVCRDVEVCVCVCVHPNGWGMDSGWEEVAITCMLPVFSLTPQQTAHIDP